MRQTAIQFNSHGLTIEGVLSTPNDAASKSGVVVVCHPHPILGGDMDSPLVVAICNAIGQHDLATLRFNFRGVKGSEGQFSNGPGERDDLAAAMAAMSRWPGIDRKRMGVAGYSFGAGVVIGALPILKTSKGLAAVAPPISMVRSMSDRISRPTLLISGTEDRVSPSVSLQRELDHVTGPVKFKEVQGADHLLAGYEEQVAGAVAEFLAEALSE